jgi:hypothetical protein
MSQKDEILDTWAHIGKLERERDEARVAAIQIAKEKSVQWIALLGLLEACKVARNRLYSHQSQSSIEAANLCTSAINKAEQLAEDTSVG